MPIILPTLAEINPAGKDAYNDKIKVWVMQSLALPKLRWLAGQCGSHKGGKLTIRERRDGTVIRFIDKDGKTVLYVLNKRARFNPSYTQHLQLNQPSHEAIQSLATINGLHLSYVEESLDWTFNRRYEREDAYRFVCRYVVKRYHGNQVIVFVGEDGSTRYSGPRKAPNVLAVYKGKPSKVTGELYCVHWDWRISGRRALERAGIHSLRDVLALNRPLFWQVRLDLRVIRRREFGRRYLIVVHGKGRQRRFITFHNNGKLAFQIDLAAAGVIIHAHNQSTQGVIDACRKWFNVGPYLHKLDNRHLLP
jgi:hypothetical protein